jgi:hypothetical protein
MKSLYISLISLVLFCDECNAVPVFSGFTGQLVDGHCQRTSFAINNLLNFSDFAYVQDGIEFQANFSDIAGQTWQSKVDFNDNYQITFQFTSGNPSANAAGGELIEWHFFGFSFDIQGLQPVSIPALQDRSLPSFDQHNIWMGFSAFTAYSPGNSYTYQLVPVPEPSMPALMAIITGMVLVVARKRNSILRVN